MNIYLDEKKVQLKGGIHKPSFLGLVDCKNYVSRLNGYYGDKADLYQSKDQTGMHLKVNPEEPTKWFISVGILETVNEYITFNTLVYLMDILVHKGVLGNNTTKIKPGFNPKDGPDVFIISQDYEDFKIDTKQSRSRLRAELVKRIVKRI